MTYIKRMILNGFKSFPKPTEIVFDRNFSVIVGPNGSGKSNITDAICFVLGRLSIKSMRAAKASNLIYNGSKNKKPANEARVELILDNSEKHFSLPGDVKIKRIVRKNGISIYKINDQTKTRQEVQELLAQAGIDPLGFNIVLQEEIARFVNMHANERRQIIEEIAGIRIYETRKEKSIHELEKTEEKLNKIGTILRERTAYLSNLNKERAQALHYKKLKQSITRDKASSFYKQLEDKKQEQERINAKIDDREKILNKNKANLNGIQERINDINKEIEKINKYVEKSTGIEQEAVHHEITESRADIAGISVRIENYIDQLTNLNNREKQLQETLKKSLPELEQLKKEKNKIIPKEIDFDSFKKQLFDLSEMLEERSKKLFQIVKQLNEKIKVYAAEITTTKNTKNIFKKLQEVSSFLSLNYKKNNEIINYLEQDFKKLEKLRNLKILQTGISKQRNIELELRMKMSDMDRMKLIIKKSAREKEELEKKITELREQLDEKEEITKEKEIKEKDAYNNFQRLFKKRSQLHDDARKNEEIMLNNQKRLREIEDDANSLRIARAKIDAEQETLNNEFQQYKEVQLPEKIDSITEIKKRIQSKQEQLEKIGNVNLRALQVYDDVKNEYDKIAEKVNKLNEEKQEILNIISEIDRKKKKTFMQVFNTINKSFMENFSKLSIKGPAYLELENPEQPFEAGINIVIKVARGKYLDAHSLSGGERTLIALGLIFAIQEFKPHHFYIFDEIDAALDKRNSERLSNLIKNYIHKAQYIMITHNDPIISAAKNLYGVSMQDGISKILSLKI